MRVVGRRVPLWLLLLLLLLADLAKRRTRALTRAVVARAKRLLAPPLPPPPYRPKRHHGKRALTFSLDAANTVAHPCGGAPMTLTRFLLGGDGCGGVTSLASVLLALSSASINAAALMRRGLRSPCTHVVGSASAPGDIERLDLAAAEIFLRALHIDGVRCVRLATHENPVYVEQSSDEAASELYDVVLDPLDGTNNADAGNCVGTIFGIYRAAEHPGDALPAGTELVAAGYVMYGPATVLCLSVGRGLHGFTLSTLGEFELTRPAIATPAHGRTYAVNEGLSSGWSAPTAAFVKSLAAGAPQRSLRYVGTFVADLHRTLLYGGLFLYPSHTRAASGKLKLVYEAAPMAFVAEQAGARAVTELGERLVELVPQSHQQRCPVVAGSVDDVQGFLAYVAQFYAR